MNDLFNTDDNPQPVTSAAATTPGDLQAAKPEPTVKPGKKAKGKALTTKDYVFFGGAGLMAFVVLYFFVFSGSEAPAPSGTGRINSTQTAPAQSAPVDDQFRSKISSIILQQKHDIDNVRDTYQQGMLTLSNQLKAANGRIENLNNEINNLKMQLASNGNAIPNKLQSEGYDFSTPQKMLKEFSINDLSNDLGWVKYKNQVYAVQVGTTIGGTTVTGFDMNKRIVYTNKGLIH